MEAVYPNEELETSEIKHYFSGLTVFVTGGTGFLGRLLIEKLLRTCDDLNRIYMLMRPKKNKSCEERFQEYFNDPLYEVLKNVRPEALNKIAIIQGDCELPDLGLTKDDRQLIISKVNSIFHCAATVRFDESLRKAAYINVRGTRDLLRIAKDVKNLSSMVYVSTAMSFCPRNEINEEFYKSLLTGTELLTLVDCLNDKTLSEITPKLIGKWPNTYTFSKSIAENIVKMESAGLPITVIRPSIVIGTSREPLPGWTDNYYGATGVFVATSLGLLRSMYCQPDYVADLVPADFVINCTIASAWNIAKTRNFTLNKEISDPSNATNGKADIPIYNYVSGPEKPLTWRQCCTKGLEKSQAVASVLQLWHGYLILVSNKCRYFILHYLLHIFPAYLVDFLAVCLRKEPQLIKGYGKIEKLLNVIFYFCNNQWIFHNKNTQKLWKKLTNEDKKLFEFNMGALDWDVYFTTLAKGCRVYLLKDPLETLPAGQAKRFKLKIAHYFLTGLLLVGFIKLLMVLYNIVI